MKSHKAIPFNCPAVLFFLCYTSFVLFLWCVYWGELGSEVRGHLHLGSGEPSPTSGGEKLSTHYFPASNTIHCYPTNYPPTTVQPLILSSTIQPTIPLLPSSQGESHPLRGRLLRIYNLSSCISLQVFLFGQQALRDTHNSIYCFCK